MRRQGHQIFLDELAQFAAEAADARVTTIAGRVAAPLRVAVRGRRGVGCSTVAHALDRAGTAAGIRVADSDADLVVYVTTEVVKPEDSQAVEAIAAARRPVLAVLNKADLAGFAGDGPIAAAQARCAALSALVKVPMEPMIGLLAVAALDDFDDALWAALRVLAAHPGGAALFAGSVDGFMAANNPLPVEDRLRLLDTLDLFGTALAVAAVGKGSTAGQLRSLLRRVSCVDAVVDQITAVGAEVRYRRVLDAVAELEALAVSGDQMGERISRFLGRDDTVVARMAAAADLPGLPGGPVDLNGDDPAAHLSRALRWQLYSVGSLGPVSDVHRACGADITRGSLRLWSQACHSVAGRAGSGESHCDRRG
jgi:hypothetical protein